MVEVTKNLANRYAALKFMQEEKNFLAGDVVRKYHVPTSFMSALNKKAVIKSTGSRGSTYTGPEATIKLAAEMYDFESNMRAGRLPKYPKATVDYKPTFTQLVEEAKQKVAGIPEVKDVTDYKQFEKKPKPIFNVTIQDGKVTMEWKEFSRLVESI